MKKGMHTRGLTRWGTQFYVVLQRLLYYSTRPFELAFEKQKKGGRYRNGVVNALRIYLTLMGFKWARKECNICFIFYQL